MTHCRRCSCSRLLQHRPLLHHVIFHHMQAVREQAALAESQHLFRGASARQVTWNIVWAVGIALGLGQVGSTLSSLPKVSQVDMFISHSWHGPAWLKHLAIGDYLNLDLAIFSSALASFAAASILAIQAGSLVAVARQPQGLLAGYLYLLPMLVFGLAYVGEHIFSTKTVCFDRLCIDQKNLPLKSRSVRALPAFVAHSTRILVLWDETWLCFRNHASQFLLLVVSNHIYSIYT